MTQDPKDYDLWLRVVEQLSDKGASVAEAIEGADLVLQARRRTCEQAKRAPPQATRDDD